MKKKTKKRVFSFDLLFLFLLNIITISLYPLLLLIFHRFIRFYIKIMFDSIVFSLLVDCARSYTMNRTSYRFAHLKQQHKSFVFLFYFLFFIFYYFLFFHRCPILFLLHFSLIILTHLTCHTP